MDDEALPPLIARRYRPVRLLGRGGMGAVYEVEHVHTGEHLALKTLLAHVGTSAAMVERFKREARVSASVRSDHIVKVIDADVAPELDGASFLVMELLDGSDLDALVGNATANTSQVVEWMRQMARGLDKAHAAGIIHRDLKPENLFLTRREDGSPLLKILDFGIARIESENASGKQKTETGSIFGTPRYMAPEQARGEVSRIGPVTDIWAVGMIVFRLLSGRDYWDGDVATHILAQIVYEPIVAPSKRGCPFGDAFDAWFLRSCNRDLTARFQSAGEQARALAEALGAVTNDAPRLADDTSFSEETVRAPDAARAVTSGSALASESLASAPTMEAHTSDPALARSGAALDSTSPSVSKAPVAARSQDASPTISSMSSPKPNVSSAPASASRAAWVVAPVIALVAIAGWAISHSSSDHTLTGLAAAVSVSSATASSPSNGTTASVVSSTESTASASVSAPVASSPPATASASASSSQPASTRPVAHAPATATSKPTSAPVDPKNSALRDQQ